MRIQNWTLFLFLFINVSSVVQADMILAPRDFGKKTTAAVEEVTKTIVEPITNPRGALARWFEYDQRLVTGEKTNFNILPLFVSSPERGIGFGIKFARQAWLEKDDIISAQAVQTLKNKSSYNLKYQFSPGDNRYPTQVQISYENYERFYYGIGNHAQEKDETLYVPEYFDINLPFSYAINESFNLGLFLDYENWKITKIEDRGILKQDLPGLNGESGAKFFTWGLLASFDNRDSKTDPSRGFYIEEVFEYSKKLFGSETDFNRSTFDARWFRSLCGNDHHVLALRFFGDYKTGDVPFYKLPELGGVFFNRGLLEGRYRDNLSLSGNAEYRLKIYHRLHWAFFIDAGNVYNGFSSIEVAHTQITGGTGMRYYVPPGNLLMARIDGAYSTEGFKLYLTFDQPF